MANPVPVTDDDFDQFIQQHPLAVVDAWAPWCGPCKRLEPILHDLAGELAGQLTVGKLNTDQNPKTAARFGIMSIPTILVFKNGKRVDQIVGLRSKDELKQTFLKHA